MIATVLEADVAAVPAVGQDRAEGVVPAAHLVGHIVGAVVDALPVVGPAGIEVIVADALAVEMQVEQTQGRGIDDRPAHGFVCLEGVPQEHSGGSSSLPGLTWPSLSLPIHWAFQSSWSSNPMLHRAEALQSDGLPFLSQT